MTWTIQLLGVAPWRPMASASRLLLERLARGCDEVPPDWPMTRRAGWFMSWKTPSINGWLGDTLISGNLQIIQVVDAGKINLQAVWWDTIISEKTISFFGGWPIMWSNPWCCGHILGWFRHLTHPSLLYIYIYYKIYLCMYMYIYIYM